MPKAPDQPPQDGAEPKAAAPVVARLLVLAGLVAVIAALFLGGSGPMAVIDAIRAGRVLTADWVAAHFALAVIACTLIYVALASLALPGALWLTIAAGFVLGPVWAVPVSLTGLTLGAINTAILVRFLVGDARRARLQGRWRRLARGFERDQLSYMIMLRLLPLPYFGVNLAAGLSQIRWSALALGTLIGALPSAILYAGFGAGLGSLAEMEALPGPTAVLQPQVLIPLAMIIPLALAPLIWRRWQRRRKGRALPGKSL